MDTETQIILPKMVQANYRIGIAQPGNTLGDIGRVRFRFFLTRQAAARAMAQECLNVVNVSAHFQTGVYTVTEDRIEDPPIELPTELQR